MKSAAATTTGPRTESLLSDVSTLVKVRLSFLVLLTTLVGFLAGTSAPINMLLLSATLLGTALSAAGASALNQWWERGPDGLMKRTRNRPLPAGRMHASDGLLFGVFFSVLGVACLGLFTNALTAILAAATITVYVLVYTPMKQTSELNTLVGAVPGALPPLIGWTAATGSIGIEGCLLFAILWFWQMPHFLAIAWMYREEYAGAGFKMLTATDSSAAATSRQSVLYCLALLFVSLLPAILRFNSALYFPGAILLGAGFTLLAARFANRRDKASARALFFASILYLPLLLGLLVATHR